MDAEIGGMQPRSERCPVNRAASHAFAAVSRPKRQWFLTGSDPHIVPIQLMRSFLIAHPVAFGIPEGSGIEANHAESGPREPLQQHTASRAHAHNDVIHLIRFIEAMHRRLDPLDGTEHVRLPVGGLKLSEDWRFQCVPPWPGEPRCSACPATGLNSPETELSGAFHS